MKHIFYFIGILFIIHKLICLLKPKWYAVKVKRFDNLKRDTKNLSWDKYSTEYKEIMLFFAIPSVLFIFWLVLGLLTFNWFVFLIYIILHLLIIAPLSRLYKNNIVYPFVLWVSNLSSFILGVFVIINSYHLKFNVFDWLYNII